MTRGSIREYAAAVRPRYLKASKREKKRILDEFCQVTGYHRKSAIRLLRDPRGAATPACKCRSNDIDRLFQRPQNAALTSIPMCDMLRVSYSSCIHGACAKPFRGTLPASALKGHTDID